VAVVVVKQAVVLKKVSMAMVGKVVAAAVAVVVAVVVAMEVVV
jgi:hypothetical protein